MWYLERQSRYCAEKKPLTLCLRLQYSIPSAASFDAVPEWVELARRVSARKEDLVIAIVGTKADLTCRRSVAEAAAACASSASGVFAETSAKTGAGVDELFECVVAKGLATAPPALSIDLSGTGEAHSGCCCVCL
eukprot:TRINITY_DN1648_c0_g2_i1.p2 TRINITY_DN1648_c0_g2~~TRINITY_DN1648_c0_g2_i1.p2  ORF type:complete len:135 (-),score=31.56 TRINITY_DN1648_c0_g2_i1:60-464(-)